MRTRTFAALITSALVSTLSTLAVGCDVTEERTVQVSTSPGYGSYSSSSSGSYGSAQDDYINAYNLPGFPGASAAVLMKLDANREPRSLDIRFASWFTTCGDAVPTNFTVAQLTVDNLKGVGTYPLNITGARFVTDRKVSPARRDGGTSASPDAGDAGADSATPAANACTWTASDGQIRDGSVSITRIDSSRVTGSITLRIDGDDGYVAFSLRPCAGVLGGASTLTCEAL